MSRGALEKLPRIAFVVASPETAKVFLLPHFRKIQSQFDIRLFANFSCGQAYDFRPTSQEHITIERRPSMGADVAAFWKLKRSFRNGNFQIVQSVTPKAGLLAMLASWFTGVPIRIHWMTGQVWVTRKGITRWYLKITDKLIAKLATHLLVDSSTQAKFLVEQKIARESKMTVLGVGSICGVDTNRFKPDMGARHDLRAVMEIEEADLVLLFVGRLNTDKGVTELLAAHSALRSHEKIHLVLVGQDEDHFKSKFKGTFPLIQTHQVHFVAHTSNPEKYMAMADIFVLPSHREGFGLSVVEAASAGVPAVASDIYGLQDAVENLNTGILFTVGDREALTSALQELISDDDARQCMGARARKRAIENFSQERLTEAYLNYLLALNNR
jgi:glycosyltransferase involved in cell wall biosynthesis